MTIACRDSTETQGMDFADPASAMSTGLGQMSVTHEVVNVCARKSMSDERVVSVEMVLELSVLDVGSATVIISGPKATSATPTLGSANASQVSLGSPATSAFLYTLDSLHPDARAAIAILRAQFLNSAKEQEESVPADQESLVVVVTNAPLAHGELLRARVARHVFVTQWELKTMTAMT